MKTRLLSLSLALSLVLALVPAAAFAADSDVITFPDPNFEKAVREMIGKPSGAITKADAAGWPSLYVVGKNISNMSGVEHFTGLIYLYCDDNPLTKIDVSGNILLEYISIRGTQITVLDLTNNPYVTQVSCDKWYDLDADISIIVSPYNKEQLWDLAYAYFPFYDYEFVLNHNRAIRSITPTDAASLARYKLPQDYIESDAKEIIGRANAITSGIASDYEKTKAIHYWVADNIYYDYDYYEGRNDYVYTASIEVLEHKRTICDGYTRLTVALIRAAGIPARYVRGEAGYAFEGHAWAEAYVDGRWIILESTWESDKTYRYGVFGERETYRDRGYYFDISVEDLSEDHVYLFQFFWDKGMAEVKLPPGMTHIPMQAFYRAENFTNITIPGSIKSIGDQAFFSCPNLTDVVIQDGVVALGDNVFQSCNNLRNITIPPSVLKIGSWTYKPNGLTIHGVKGSYAWIYANMNNINFAEITTPVPDPLDAPSEWAIPVINTAIEIGYLTPALQGGYQYNITRGEFCALAVSLIETLTGQTMEVGTRTFADDGGDLNIRKMAH
ncbi:MAG: leucine-rich repeat protein, partial [Oscillospiraceae bacterium]|nr:leucine-rich repeat protein [Oscillospiraceae bacterium]